ncbi:hypothetical protein SAMN05192564_102302 [Paraburkholderia sartisoli]|uniref:Uncharacterized protein n=1 Tax=Paraburkholderia sartisoli TaxID=83784 RepID=A0A1H4CGU8_9BURK|nr:hypothetical protein SAMN05192564_102302 [Paraburkholderia sartisoli]
MARACLRCDHSRRASACLNTRVKSLRGAMPFADTGVKASRDTRSFLVCRTGGSSTAAAVATAHDGLITHARPTARRSKTLAASSSTRSGLSRPVKSCLLNICWPQTILWMKTFGRSTRVGALRRTAVTRCSPPQREQGGRGAGGQHRYPENRRERRSARMMNKSARHECGFPSRCADATVAKGSGIRRCAWRKHEETDVAGV